MSRAAIEAGSFARWPPTSLKRSRRAPDLPTVAESGLPGFDAVLPYGMVGAGRHAAADRRAAQQGAQRCARHRRGQAPARQEGAEPMPTTPEEHAAEIDPEETKWSAHRQIGRHRSEMKRPR